MEDANQMQNVLQQEAEGTEKLNPVTPTEAAADGNTTAQQATEQPIELNATAEPTTDSIVDEGPAEPQAEPEACPAAAEVPAAATEEAVADTPKAPAAVADEAPVAAPEASAAASEEIPAAAPTTEDNSSPEDKKAHKEPLYVEPDADYAGLSREQLTDALKELMGEDVMHIRNRCNKIKELFADLNREVQKSEYEAFLADGGDKATYEQHNDNVADMFFKLYDTYRDERQKRLDEMEAVKLANAEKKTQVINELRQLAESQEQISIKEMHNRFNKLQEQWKEIGDVPRANANDLWQSYHLWADQLFAKIKLERESMMEDMKRNLEKKVLLCEQAEEQLVNEDEVKAYRQLQELRSSWKQIGPVPMEQNDTIWTRFQDAAERINTRYKESLAARHEMMEKNLLAKQALVEQSAELTSGDMPTKSKDWKVLSDKMDALLKTWKAIGPVPREQSETIWNTFIAMREKVYKEKKKFFEELRASQDANYKKKVELCEKAEIIACRDDMKEATGELLQLQSEWKTSGVVRHDLSEQLWKRFRSACDKFFDRKNERYSEMHVDEAENLQKKEAVLAELKAMTFGEDKDENLRRLKEIQRRWVEIGFVPRHEKDRIQKDFRSTINNIFNQLKLTAREAEETAFKERVQRHAGDTHFAHSERGILIEKIDHLRNDIKTLENNLGFFNNSKQANLLKEEFERKIQDSRQQVALLESKLKILDATPKDAPKETAKETKNVAAEETGSTPAPASADIAATEPPAAEQPSEEHPEQQEH